MNWCRRPMRFSFAPTTRTGANATQSSIALSSSWQEIGNAYGATSPGTPRRCWRPPGSTRRRPRSQVSTWVKASAYRSTTSPRLPSPKCAGSTRRSSCASSASLGDAVRALKPAKRAPRNDETLAKVREFFPAPGGRSRPGVSSVAPRWARRRRGVFSRAFVATIRDADEANRPTASGALVY